MQRVKNIKLLAAGLGVWRYSLAKSVNGKAAVVAEHEIYLRDPLRHPDIARMSEREKADLPFDPYAIKP